MTLELEDIQGDILRAYGNHYDCTTYVFLGVRDEQSGRALMADLAALVTDAAPWTAESKPERHFNVAVTYYGLLALGVPQQVADSFSPEFRLGMAARAARLGDVGPSEPAHWEAGLGTGAAHVLVTVNALDPTSLKAAMDELGMLIEQHGPTVVTQRQAELMPDTREHFGFADGFAQPAIVGASDDKAAGGGVPIGGGKWRPLQPGEFVLGYPDEDTVLDEQRRLPDAPIGPLGRNGTYMVWRRLHQDVARFRQVVKAAAEHYEGGDEERLRAKIVGRWDDGSPLVDYPDAPATAGADGTFDQTAPGANDFTYRHSGDEAGARCPIGSHVRRSNPRDGLGWEGALSFRHRIIRRGMPYGPRLPEDVTEDDGADRGLVFVCFQASIARQFEAIQVQWLNDGNVFGLGHDTDFIMGTHRDAGGSMVIQGERPFYLSQQDDFVTMRGGEYLFVPGISGLRAIASGTTAP
ncbi:MAG TPA: Dyp-type peroxidase [Nocardioidaceae bacterium]|nr:Dyp-type peroxidase [Nocardioidaceae bacterium]